jgi:hypothetical protein
METPTAELKTYHGNCHCGAFKFIIKTPEFTTARTCDCSICTQKSYFWVFPKKEDVTVLRGEENLTEYTFGTNQYLHKVGESTSLAPVSIVIMLGCETSAKSGLTVNSFAEPVVQLYTAKA